MTRWPLLVLLAACGGSRQPRVPQTSDRATAPPREGIVLLDTAPADALVLDVRAIRWACTVTHAHGVATSELRVPVGRAITLHVWTPEWPQDASGMEVALVGTTIVKSVVRDKPVDITFRVDRPGTYAWRCPTILPPPIKSEPGADLSDEVKQQLRDNQNPIKRFEVMPAADYDAFIAASDPDKPENALALGRKLYAKKGCNACHSVDGAARVGPTWKGIWGTTVVGNDGTTRVVDDGYVESSLVTPQAFVVKGFPTVMPSFEGQIKPREIAALTAYIRSLQ